MKKILLRAVILIALSACVLSCRNLAEQYPDAEITETEAGNTLIVTGDFTAMILTREFMETKAPWVSPPEYWTPQVDQIFEIESSLAEYLAQHGDGFNSGRAPDKEKLSTYGRQYIGWINTDGKYILGSFFCAHHMEESDWQNQVVSVFGGGDCYFGIWWDPNTREFISVHANSPK
jgi:hypothetical protein